MGKQRFKTSLFKASDTGQMFRMYEPTIQMKGSKLIDDKSFAQYRVSSMLDHGFAVPLRKRRK